MSSWIVLLALPAQMFFASAIEARWVDDYGAALRQARFQRLPLLVVIEDPSDSNRRIEQIRFAVNQTETDLLSNYKLCRVDVRTPYGQEVAKVFHAKQLPHTSIIDNTGSVQIFVKSGSFATDEWTTALATHKEGKRRSQRSARYERIGGGGRICFT